MPGLSYVCGSAEVSLRMVVGSEAGKHKPRTPQSAPPEATPQDLLFQMLNASLDKKTLMREAEAATKSVTGKKDDEEEEEDEDGGDE